MKEKLRAIVQAAFVADALALAAHWIYDPALIREKFGTIDHYHDPLPDSYHPTKKAGQFTHYGDQMLLLLESLSKDGKFDFQNFALRWMKFMTDYSGYKDHATKETLANLQNGVAPNEAGSDSRDLAGAARTAPLLCIFHDNPEAGIEAAVKQTALTHNNPLTIAAAEFIARTVYAILDGYNPRKAMENTMMEMNEPEPLASWIKAGIKSRNEETSSTISRFGRDCDVESALPAVAHLVTRHGNNLRTCLMENVMAGGDSAARGMAAAMLLGAHLGSKAIPQNWLDDLEQKDQIEKLLGSILK